MKTQNPDVPIILYAEDDVDDAAYIRKVFNEKNANVNLIVVPNGAEAVEFLKHAGEQKISLIILDINMPKMDGREALVRIRSMKRYQDTPIVLFTTSAMEPDKKFARSYKAEYIRKPAMIHQMDAIVDQLLAMCSNQQTMNFH
jgi:CheY-like chemotaxis protein